MNETEISAVKAREDLLELTVYGIAKPQGSKRGFVVNGRAVLVDDNKHPLRSWREDVRTAALESRARADMRSFPTGPVGLFVTFYLPRPQTHYGLSHGERYLKPTAPVWVDKRPDLDKMLRAVCDALTSAGVYHDDAQVAQQQVLKAYAGGEYAAMAEPGAWIRVQPMANNEMLGPL
jgi:crossover junction endodeoxyribonuclease RusA